MTGPGSFIKRRIRGQDTTSQGMSGSFQAAQRYISQPCSTNRTWLKYQGRHFDFIGFDELTHFTEKTIYIPVFQSKTFRSGDRGVCTGHCKPWSIGHGWVKKQVCIITTPGTIVVTDVVIHDPKGKEINCQKTESLSQVACSIILRCWKIDPG